MILRRSEMTNQFENWVHNHYFSKDLEQSSRSLSVCNMVLKTHLNYHKYCDLNLVKIGEFKKIYQSISYQNPKLPYVIKEQPLTQLCFFMDDRVNADDV